MLLEFLSRQDVRSILFELMWGDRFEKDLRGMTSSDEEFDMIANRLDKDEIVYRLKGENSSQYMSLTDKGVAIISRLHDIERILEGEDIDSE